MEPLPYPSLSFLLLDLADIAPQPATMEAHLHEVARNDRRAVFDDLLAWQLQTDTVAATQDGQRAQRVQLAGDSLQLTLEYRHPSISPAGQRLQQLRQATPLDPNPFHRVQQPQVAVQPAQPNPQTVQSRLHNAGHPRMQVV